MTKKKTTGPNSPDSRARSLRGGHRLYLLLALVLALHIAPSKGLAIFERVNSPNPADPMAVHIYRLENGLTVYLTANREKPRFYAEVAVRAGSKHDPSESTGLAHYLEHMLLKGTDRIGTLDHATERVHLDRISELYEELFKESDPDRREGIYAEINKESQLASRYAIPNEIDKLYKEMGGGHNASTWHEQTVYQVDLPANRLVQWAVVESERFRRPVFRFFQPELEVVYEEKNRSQDNKDRIIREAVGGILYKNHPYGQQTTLGKAEHLKNPSLKNMYWFLDTFYVPDNMAILISGDFDIEEAIRTVDRHFSGLPPKALPRPKGWEEAPLRGREFVSVSYEGEEYALIAFRTAERNHPDAEVFKLLDMVLDNRTAGLINLNLNQQQRVRRAGSYPNMHNDYGAQYLWGIPKKGQSLEEVEGLLLDQVTLIKKGEFEDWILPAIIVDFEKSRKRQMESNRGRVGQMREAFLAFQDWDHAVGEIARMGKVTKEDLVQAAKITFGDDYVVGNRVDERREVPKIEKPKMDKIDIDPTRRSVFFDRVISMPYEGIEPEFIDPQVDYRKVDFHDGVVLSYTPNPINDLFTLSIAIDIGNNQDNRIGIATRLIDKSGTATYGPEDLKKEWYKLGTDFSIGSGTDETTIRISGLDENLEASLVLMMDVMKNPKADKVVLDELIKIILVGREDARKDPRTIRRALAHYSRHRADSRYLRVLPSRDVQRLTVDELHNLVRGLLNHKHTISYTGSLPLDQVVVILKRNHPISGTLTDPPPYLFLKAQVPEETEIRYLHKEVAQAQVYLEFGDEDYNEANIPAIQLYNSYFAGGMSGVVFQELREARALAYATGAGYTPGHRKGDQNLVWGGLGCQADKTPEAVETFIDLMDNLPVSSQRFESSQESILNQYRSSKLGFREILGAVRSWERLKVRVDPRRSRYEKVLNADMNLMLQFHKAHIEGRLKLVSVVGDTSRIDMERLGKSGNLMAVELDDIFIF